jgi:uncharacterized SAM-binding protein YcdF (DUF218 family)
MFRLRRRQKPARTNRLARVMVLFGGAGVIAAALFFGSFALFALDVALSTPPNDPHADGIVVLTGGTARIESGLQLLAEGRGDRLLISGVDPKVGRETLARISDGSKRAYFDCCIDFDHARDTIGNAVEARRWAAGRGYRSLIVVTSDYHMPRSIAELGASMPGKRLIPYPVADGDEPIGERLVSERSVRLLFGEFLKYLAVRMRHMIGPGAEPEVRMADRPLQAAEGR